jgi:hypothetical protein
MDSRLWKNNRTGPANDVHGFNEPAGFMDRTPAENTSAGKPGIKELT